MRVVSPPTHGGWMVAMPDPSSAGPPDASDVDVNVDPNVIVGALADGDRRRLLAAIELGAATLQDAARAGGLADHRAAKALGWLVANRLVTSDAVGALRVDGDAFRRAASVRLARPSDEHAGEPPERRKVLDAFVRGGRITAMPASAPKRLVLLDWLAGTFDVGRRYTEAEVNAALEGHVEDHVSLRRALVDAGLLDRDAGTYWRCGGTVD
jgi:hypothetical protein